MNASIIKEKILKAIQSNLPGSVSQIKMLPEGRLPKNDIDKTEKIKKSAVLLLLIPENDTYKLLFIKRADDGSKHSGQIAFPGGKVEGVDNGLAETALRECEEEVGIVKEDIIILKPLSSLFIPVSNFFVKPFLGIIDYKPGLNINPDEVQKVFLLDIKELFVAKPVIKKIKVRGKKITAPFYVFDEFEIWGASAMILSEFIDLLKTELK